MGHHHDFSWSYREFHGERPMRVGIGGPVGSGKTAMIKELATVLKERFQIGVITNDIYTKEDGEFLKKRGYSQIIILLVSKRVDVLIRPFEKTFP